MGEVKRLRPINTPNEEFVFLNPIKPKSLEYVIRYVGQLINKGWSIKSIELMKGHNDLYLICLQR